MCRLDIKNTKWAIAVISLFGILYACWWLYDCSHRQSRHSYIESKVNEMLTAAHEGNIHTSDSIAGAIYSEALNNGDELLEAYGLYGLGLFSSKDKDLSRKDYLLQAEKKAVSLSNDSLLSRVYNALGSYATGVEHDFSNARRYFTMAIHHSRKIHATEYEMTVQCNLSELARQMNDTVDINEDIKVFKFAKSTRNDRLLNAAAHHCAYYYLKDPKTADKALPYIQAMAQTGDSIGACCLMLNYYTTTDSLEKARSLWDIYVKYDSVSPVALYNNGVLLFMEGKNDESIRCLDLASDAFANNRMFQQRPLPLNLNQARNYAALGRNDKAVDYYERYIADQDSVYVVRSASEVAWFKILYQLEKKERDGEAQRQFIMRMGMLASFLGFIIVACVVGWWFYARNKRQYMMTIVAQNDDNIRKIKSLENYIALLEKKSEIDSMKVPTLPQADDASAESGPDKVGMIPIPG